jgi:hypothetical protein
VHSVYQCALTRSCTSVSFLTRLIILPGLATRSLAYAEVYQRTRTRSPRPPSRPGHSIELERGLVQEEEALPQEARNSGEVPGQRGGARVTPLDEPHGAGAQRGAGWQRLTLVHFSA